MIAISEWQPWGSAIVLGHKEWETRHWTPPIRIIGKRILIHAAKQKFNPREYEGFDLYDQLVIDGLYELWLNGKMPFGALIGTAILERWERSETLREKISRKELTYGNYMDGRFGWRMVDPVAFPDPIPYRGAQGFFDVPDDLVPREYRP